MSTRALLNGGKVIMQGYLNATALAATVAIGACANTPPDETSRTEQAVTTCITIQRGVNGTAVDAMLSNPPQDNNFGRLPIVRVGMKDEGLFRFELGAIPSTAVVNSATLTLFVNGSASNASIGIHNATKAWAEATVTYANFGQSFDLQPSAIISPSSPNAFKSADLTALVQRWVSGADPNFGVLLETTTQKNTIFVSADGDVTAQHPALRVCYTTPDDHCAAAPCQNGGSCTNQQAGYVCECPAGYTGANCETVIDNCAANPCENGGACTSSTDGYSCTCPTGYIGTTCETLVDHCSGSPCQHAGTCSNNTDGYTCACPVGYVGANCETVVDNCSANPCQNGASCANGAGTYSCACVPGYSGTNCETQIDNCTPGLCENGGTCVNEVNAFICACAPGYTGPSCAIQIDDCAAAPCQNGGTCVDGVASYACQCAHGYSGDNCEIDINECAAQPCHNGGLCIDGTDSFTCQCPSPYSGDTCDTLPSDPCLAAGGMLVPLVGSYTITTATSLAALLCVNEITGTLTINTDASVPTVTLPSLKKVGAVTVASTATSSSVDLSAVTSTMGVLLISPNASLVTLDMSHAIHRGVTATASPNLTTLRLGTFVDVVSDVFLQNVPLLSDLGPNGLSSVREVDRDFVVQNTGLGSLGPTGISNLVVVARSLSLINNAKLIDLGPTSLVNLTNVGSLRYGGGGITLQGSPLVTTVDASNAYIFGLVLSNDAGLTSFRVGTFSPTKVSDVFLQTLPVLTDLGPNGLSSVVAIDRDFTVQSTALTNLGPTGISNLVTVARSLFIVNNAKLTSLGPTSLVNLTAAGSLPYGGGGITVVGSTLLTTVDASNALVYGLNVSNNPNLTSFRTGGFATRVMDVTFQNDPVLSDLGPNGLSSVRAVDRDLIVQSTALTSLGPTGVANLTTVARNLFFINNNSLTDLGPTSLVNVTAVGSAPYGGGTLAVQGCPLVTAVDASNATVWGLFVTNDAALTSFRIGAFNATIGDVILQNVPLLTDLGPNGLSTVRVVGRDVTIVNTGLPHLGGTGLANLVSTGRTLQVSSNPNLTSVSPTTLANLASVGSTAFVGGGDLTVTSNPLLASVAAPSMTAIAGSLRVDRNTTLSSLRFDVLTNIGTNLTITNNPGLLSCFAGLLSQLVGFTGAVSISGNGVSCP